MVSAQTTVKVRKSCPLVITKGDGWSQTLVDSFAF